ISLFEIAYSAGGGYELAFFEMLTRRLELLLQTQVTSVQLVALNPCVKHLRGTRVWSRACDVLRAEIVCFVREKLSAVKGLPELNCSRRYIVTIFEKIIAREISADMVLEKEHLIAFRGVNPQAPLHFGIVP